MQRLAKFLAGFSMLVGYFVGVIGFLVYLAPVLKALSSSSIQVSVTHKLLFLMLLIAILANFYFARIFSARPRLAAGLMGISGLMVFYAASMVGNSPVWQVGNWADIFFQLSTLAIILLLLLGALLGFIAGMIGLNQTSQSQEPRKIDDD